MEMEMEQEDTESEGDNVPESTTADQNNFHAIEESIEIQESSKRLLDWPLPFRQVTKHTPNFSPAQVEQWLRKNSFLKMHSFRFRVVSERTIFLRAITWNLCAKEPPDILTMKESKFLQSDM